MRLQNNTVCVATPKNRMTGPDICSIIIIRISSRSSIVVGRLVKFFTK